MPISDESTLRTPAGLLSGATVPAKVRQALAPLVEATPEADRVVRYVNEFEQRYPSQLALLASDHGQRLQWLVALFGHSHFLAEELLQHPEWIAEVSDLHRVLQVTDYQERLGGLLAQLGMKMKPAATGFRHIDSFELAYFRRKELLRIVLRDVLSLATLSDLTEELSNLADAILSAALTSVIAEVSRRFGSPVYPGQSEANDFCGFSVIALGKLGGRELNYSSDIDLMFIYPENGETSGPEVITNKEFVKRVANRCTDLLSTYTSEGLCYRVDLRLRPEGSLGEVCLSLNGACDYYAKRARDWELQMLIKARAAAGDIATGQALLDFVEPLIYSTTLDFTAIETMSATRERISEKLAAKRLRHGQYDVKLTRGGIRDIEFLVQCLQRLHGGRQAWVRHAGTLLALSRLLDKDLLSATEYARLVNAYQFLRHLEHRLQFEDDQQTHILPSEPAALERIARRMGGASQSAVEITNSTQLLQILNEHLENVQAIYERIVHAQRPLRYGPLADMPQARPESGDWSSIREEAATQLLSPKLAAALQQDAPQLAEVLSKRGIRRARRAFEHFLDNLLGYEQKPFRDTLNDHPLLASYVMQIFETSPYFAEQLIRQPQLVDEVRRVADHPERRWSFEGLAAPLNDVAALRRFFGREMLRLQAGSICLAEPIFQTLDRTSALAEFFIARGYRITLEQAMQHARERALSSKPFEEPRDEMMVVALGRLGMREFDLASDADLLFIIPDSEAVRHKFWTRVAEHLIEILTAYTADGNILSIDTRLRPNGREGPLVQTESSYAEYFESKAEAWEGIAYMKARGVAGDCERATGFLSGLQKVDWRRYGQSGRSKQDLRQMRLRLEREQGASSPFKAGRGGFYDCDFILMYLRLRGAGLFYKSLNTPERIDIVEKMGHLDRVDAEFLLEASTFYRALDHAIRLVTGHAEGRLPSARMELDMVSDLLYRWTGTARQPAEIDSALANLQNQTRSLFERVFS